MNRPSFIERETVVFDAVGRIVGAFLIVLLLAMSAMMISSHMAERSYVLLLFVGLGSSVVGLMFYRNTDV